MVSGEVNFLYKNGRIRFSIAVPLPHDNFKISAKLYALPSPINIANMIRQHTEFPPTARLPWQT